MTITFPIVKIKLRAGTIISWIVFAICSIYLLISTSYPEVRIYVGKFNTFLGIIYALSMVGMIFLQLIFLNYRIIGTISIDNSMVKIFENNTLTKEFPFNKIRQIKFEYNETAMDGGYGVRFGINNSISVTDYENNVEKYKIKIESPSMIIHIDKKLDSLSNDFEVIKIRKRKIVNKL